MEKKFKPKPTNVLFNTLNESEIPRKIEVNVKDVYADVKTSFKKLKLFTYSIDWPFSNWEKLDTDECRGIVFNESGEIVCRPLPKFWNLGENDHMILPYYEDVNNIDVLYPKLDGTLISFFSLNGILKCKTNNSFNNKFTAKAEKLLLKNPKLQYLIESMVQHGYTVCCEMCMKDVHTVRYDKDFVKILHAVNNKTGSIISDEQIYYLFIFNSTVLNNGDASQFFNEVVCRPIDVKQLDINQLKSVEEEEGFIAVYKNKQFVKIKTDWYIRNKRLQVGDMSKKDFVMAVLQGNLDDLKSRMDTECRHFAERLEAFIYALRTKIETESMQFVDARFTENVSEFFKNSGVQTHPYRAYITDVYKNTIAKKQGLTETKNGDEILTKLLLKQTLDLFEFDFDFTIKKM